jgi:uncharacterized membrane protein YfcA
MAGDDHNGRVKRRFVPVLLGVWLAWAVAMSAAGAWELFLTRWPMALTMVFGSFIAGSTPAGGGSVAYPVFTKMLGIPSGDAALFGLMIQAVGMSMAALFILVRQVKFSAPVWRWTVIGSVPGVLIGLLWVHPPLNYPKLTFSCMLLAFGVAIYRSHWARKHEPERAVRPWTTQTRLRFIGVGLVGGVASSQLGSGADMLCFMVITIAYGLDERQAVPTSVLVMAATSVAGFVFRMVLTEPVGVVWEYWAVAVPVVAIGAPFGSWVASRVRGDLILRAVLVLIAVEVASTIVLVPIDEARAMWVVAVFLSATAWFRAMRRRRERHLGLGQGRLSEASGGEGGGR